MILFCIIFTEIFWSQLTIVLKVFFWALLRTGIFLYFLYHVDHIAYRIAKEHTKNGVCIIPC